MFGLVAGFWFSSAAMAAPELQPTVMLEADLLVQPAEDTPAEFRIARLYGGIRAKITGQWKALAVVNAVGENGPKIVDANLSYTPIESIELSLGYAKTPLFALARDRGVETHALPELPLTSRSFWPGRDTGLEAFARSPKWPVEGRVRVGNGSGNALGKAGIRPAVDVRLDATAGRQRFKAERETSWGVRVGGGFHQGYAASDREAIHATTGSSFTPWEPPLVQGNRWVAEGHAVVDIQSVEIHLEGAYAHESRVIDDDENPDTPAVDADPVNAWGFSGEIAWMVLGQHRAPYAWPVANDDKPGVELALRAGRLASGLGADDVDAGGALGGEAGARLWLPQGVAIGTVAQWLKYDSSSERDTSFSVLVRATAALGK